MENDIITLHKLYLAYLVEWALTHASVKFLGMSPASWEEWLDCEAAEEE